MTTDLKRLSEKITGELHYDEVMRTLYSTDASAYRELPLAVAIPKSKEDIRELLAFARENGIGIIPRAAGTSLAGQVVGNGLVVDISKHFTKIIEINKEQHYAIVQPGVIRDELNHYAKPFGLFYGPETSTSNRCMMGGMVGNNSCGARSLVYGSAREHLIAIKGFLADGSETEFGELTTEEFEAKCRGENVSGELEQKIYQQAKAILGNAHNRELFLNNYPKPSVPRRNTGYALDLLANADPFGGNGKFNFCKLIAGSEGTLFFATEIKVNLSPALKPLMALQAIHFNSIRESLLGNLVALKYQPTSIELMDHYVLECTKENIEQRKNRFFVEGDPAAILVVEFLEDSEEEINRKTQALEAELRAQGLGTHFPVVRGEQTKQVWELRKAGLGLLSNIPGDAKAVAVIEDTAVDVNDLPDFIEEFNAILKQRGLYCVHYAHAATGELHLRPIIDLKTAEGTQLFRTIATDIAQLTKKYRGSLSGEHGDGRLRGEFIAYMMGEELYQLFREVKKCWDPWNLFNPGKIVDTPPMDTFLRYTPGQETPQFDTVFDFSHNDGIVRAAELCNGSGDCRKTEIAGGTMCPSYMATRNEKETTRARANILRETLTNKETAFDNKEILEVMDLCLSCKGCKSECPSNVDVAKLKAEALHQYYKINGVPLRSKLIGNITKLNRIASFAPGMYNGLMRSPIGTLIKKVSGFSTQRELPPLSSQTFASWFKKYQQTGAFKNGRVHLFNDEFLNYNDALLGITAVQLLNKLGYEVIVPQLAESGRTYLSKGLLTQAQALAEKNVQTLLNFADTNEVLIGIEPSAILTFRDEYPDLCRGELKAVSQKLAKRVFLIEEFLANEVDAGRIDGSLFTEESRRLRIHGHCHQKALSSMVPVKKILSLPKNYQPLLIPSGCCGMAGSFGYEKEHYNLSMQVGELVLFPTIRKEAEETIIVAPGTSCRHQIADGTGRKALHPVEVLWEAMRDK